MYEKLKKSARDVKRFNKEICLKVKYRKAKKKILFVSCNDL